MKVIAYTRVSTDGQCGEDRFGLEAQKDIITKYCEENGHEIVRWVSDEGESGAKYRPGFDEIIYSDEISNPPYEAVVVAKTDRVARDINVYYYYKASLARKNVQLLSVSEDFGQFGMFAPMLESFIVCMAQMERENICKRTAGGRKVKASKGGYSGGRAPMGYKVEAGNLIPNPDEVPIVKFIFQHKFAGDSMNHTTIELNAAGYRTRSGKPFQVSSVKSIWENERTYRGEYRYGKDGEWVKGQHEPLLKEDDR